MNKKEPKTRLGNYDTDLTDTQYYCEICGKSISEDEYEGNGGVCEECSVDINIHYDNYGLDDYTKPYADLIDDPDVYNDLFEREKDDDELDFLKDDNDFDEF